MAQSDKLRSHQKPFHISLIVFSYTETTIGMHAEVITKPVTRSSKLSYQQAANESQVSRSGKETTTTREGKRFSEEMEVKMPL